VIVRCFDSAVIKSIFTHPKIWPHISDDACDIKTFEPVLHDSVYYLVPTINGVSCGVFMYVPQNAIMYEVHSCILPEHRGAYSVNFAKESLYWMVSNTGCKKVITHVPEKNRLALAFAKRAGMTIEGVNRKSYQKAGEIFDQFILGITEKEICQQRHQSLV
jgi:hypothetical protein